MATIKIEIGRAGHTARIYIDGQVMENVRSVTLKAAIDDLTTVLLEFIPEAVEVEGEISAAGLLTSAAPCP